MLALLLAVDKKVDKKNLVKTLERKSNKKENIYSEYYRNVRWNPLVQDWVPLEKYDEVIEIALANINNITRLCCVPGLATVS